MSAGSERDRVNELAAAVGVPAARRLIDLFCQGITKGHGSIAAAVDEMDREQVEAEAHRVKGVSIQMGATELAEMCRLLEKGAHSRSQDEMREVLARMVPEMERVLTVLKRVSEELSP